MKLEFFNSPAPQDMSQFSLPETPGFTQYEPGFAIIEQTAEKFGRYRNVLVVGHGGSITSFYGIYHALRHEAKKEAYFLSTVDPDYIYELKEKLKPEDTVVVAISKSGETVTQIEALMQFVEYPMLLITGKQSALRQIGEKLGAEIIDHPPIGGRYTGLTEIALVPAALCGMDVELLYKGAKPVYGQYRNDNLAWKAASVFFQLEEQGIIDVFMPFYSHNLYPLSSLIVQLCHESFGKQGKGQTYFAHEAPESQHHTNQRFFGGKRNIAGFFTTVDNFIHPTENIYPTNLHGVTIKDSAIFDLNRIPLEEAMKAEVSGTMEDARINGIPLAHLAVSGFVPEEVGALLAFWQLYAVYSSALRQVDPFDQPQVENSKKISFAKRLAFKGLS